MENFYSLKILTLDSEVLHCDSFFESQFSTSPCIGSKALDNSPEDVFPIATEVINFSRLRDLTHWDLKKFLSRNGSRV